MACAASRAAVFYAGIPPEDRRSSSRQSLSNDGDRDLQSFRSIFAVIRG